MSNIFNSVKAPLAKTSLFNLSHEVKNTTKFGLLTPFLCQEVLPGDIWKVKTEILTRLLAMKSPIMHNVNVYTHFFFVPYRLIWKDWEKFVTQSLNGTYKNDTPELPLLWLQKGLSDDKMCGPGSLLDYLGCKMQSAIGSGGSVNRTVINSLPLLAYQKVWSDFYRDENLDNDIPEEIFDLPSGISKDLDLPLNVWANMILLRYRSFAKDYFTSALPFVQKGDAMVLPISGSAPVTIPGGQSSNIDFTQLQLNASLRGGSEEVRVNHYSDFNDSGFSSLTHGFGTATGELPMRDGNLYGTISYGLSGTADLSNASAVTINELRTLNALQRWSEANARGGSRYIEQLLSHFGVVSDDARLQRAEYLGGGKSPIVISEVLQTSGSTIDGSDTPQGNMAGHGVGASINHAFKRRFKEHGILLGIMSVMPKANYMQGIPRMFLKRDVFDFGWPLLANLGEQPIYNEELYFDTANGVPENTSDMGIFGYTPRYAEYKFIPDQIAGDFRTSLDYWHLAREFGNTPALNSSFISTQSLSQNPRVFPAPETDYILNQMYLDCRVIRKLPKYGTPKL